MVWLQKIILLSCVFTLIICLPVAPAETSEGCCGRAWRAFKGIVGVTSSGEVGDEDSSFVFQDEISSTQEERSGELIAEISLMRSIPLDPKKLFDAKIRSFTIALGRAYEFLYRGTSFDDIVGDTRLEEIGRDIIRVSATPTYRVFGLPKQARKGAFEYAIFRCNEDGQILFESEEDFEQRVFNAINDVKKKSGALLYSTDKTKLFLCGVIKGLGKKVYDCTAYGMGLGDVVVEKNSSNGIVIKPGPGCLVLPKLGVIFEEEVAEEI